ncbi:MAG: glycosyltransferase, partial [Bacteroidales bacterium]|nr:glycosyltransferase [Bacteroidales bacterium]
MDNLINRYQKKEVIEYPNNTLENKPLVSVIVVTYQHVNFIKDCIDGILMQKTDFPFEILLGEDASTDGTREVCITYAEKYPDKIRLFLHHRENNMKINGMPTGRFNLMYNLLAARGKYIALCEGDDYWKDPLKLQKQVDFLESNCGYSMCFHEAMTIWANGDSEKFNKINKDTVFEITDLTQKNFISTASCVFRRNFNDLPEWYKELNAGDWGLHFYNATFGKIYYMSDCMSVYRQHSKSIWSSLPYREMIFKGVEVMRVLDRAFNYKYHKDFEKGINKRIAKLKLNKYDEFVNIKFNSKNLDRYVVRKSICSGLIASMGKFNGKMLDVGCGKMPYKALIYCNSKVEKVVGLDIEDGLVYDNEIPPDFTWDGKKMPFGDESFDCA